MPSLFYRRNRAGWFAKWRLPCGRYFCYWCGESLTSKQVTRDHVIPKYMLRKLRKTGVRVPSHSYSSNEVPACNGCNSRRGRITFLIAKLHRLEHVRTIKGVPRHKMIECERRWIAVLGSEFVEWKY